MYSLHFSTEFSFFVIIKYGGEKCNGDLSPISSLLKSDSGQLLVGKSGAHEILATTPGTDEERRTFITTKDKKRRHNFFSPSVFRLLFLFRRNDFCFAFSRRRSEKRVETVEAFADNILQTARFAKKAR